MKYKYTDAEIQNNKKNTNVPADDILFAYDLVKIIWLNNTIKSNKWHTITNEEPIIEKVISVGYLIYNDAKYKIIASNFYIENNIINVINEVIIQDNCILDVIILKEDNR